MKPQKKVVTGKISDKGELRMYMDELREFFKLHKGRNIVATFAVIPEEQSKALRYYYDNYVVPTFKQAMWDNGERVTEDEAACRMREISPVTHEKGCIRGIDDLGNDELVEHIEIIAQYAAENYSAYIEEPKK